MQGQEAQTPSIDPMGYRIVEMKDLLTQRELRMETQVREICCKFKYLVRPTVEPMESIVKNRLKETVVSLAKVAKNNTPKSKEWSTTPMIPQTRYNLARSPNKAPPQIYVKLEFIQCSLKLPA